jgi:EmrB/QacA subfamily drug resistance transporter
VKKWLPLAILGAAQFVMVLDSSVMNVSISQIVADLNTTIQGVQAAITFYTLVMAAFMLVGAKLGDLFGRNRIFAVGLGVYGVGSLTTALSPNLAVLLIGWSLVEGLGAVMVIPAIAALIVTLYEGKDRALAYGLIGGVAGAAVAAGPLIGGWVTTTFSWRWVFVGEVVVVAAILLVRGRMPTAPREGQRPRLDLVGAALSAAGLGLIVFGVLQSSTWGWIEPHNPPSIGGHELTPLGFSVVPFLIVGGLGLLIAFASWEERCERIGRDTLLDRSLLRIEQLKAGLSTLGLQQLVLMGTFFVLPVYLQVVLGLDAFETGKRLFPMSIAMLVAALGGPRLAERFAPRTVCQIGLAAVAVAAFVLLGTIDVDLNRWGFAVGLTVFGVGAGLLISQLGNVIMSSVDPSRTNEAGGLQGTAQNLGASLGTALIGAVLLTGLTSGFVARIQTSSDLPQRAQSQISAAASEKGLEVVPVDDVEQAARDAGLSRADAEAVATSYGEALLEALKRSLGAVAVLALLGLRLTRKLPGRLPAPRSETVAAPRERPAAASRGPS